MFRVTVGRVFSDGPTATMQTGSGPKLWNSLPAEQRQTDISIKATFVWVTSETWHAETNC